MPDARRVCGANVRPAVGRSAARRGRRKPGRTRNGMLQRQQPLRPLILFASNSTTNRGNCNIRRRDGPTLCNAICCHFGTAFNAWAGSRCTSWRRTAGTVLREDDGVDSGRLVRGACFGKDSPCVSLAEELVELAVRVCRNEGILCASLSVGAIFASLRRSGNRVQVLPEAGRTAKCVALPLDLRDALVRKSLLVHCERCSTSGQTARFIYVIDWRH